MPAAKVHARPQDFKPTEDELSDASVQSGHTTESSDDDAESDSDSLDSQSSRKRRKLSPVPDDDDDDDEPRTSIPVPIRVNSTQRIKSVGKNNAVNGKNLQGAALAPIDPETTFTSLNVKPWLVGSLKNMAIRRPTGIQKGCIPEILKGRDCIGGSRTGSGKTVAFAVPILQKWAEDPFGIFALVLTPTRYVNSTQITNS
jgi:ATP-dependent RNA helicase DDX49/DBP8